MGNYSIDLAAGTYRARAISAGAYETPNGALMVGIQFELENPEQNTITARLCLVTKSGIVMEKTISRIREWAPGWDGVDTEWFGAHYPEFDVNVVIERKIDSYDGVVKPEVAFINPRDRVVPGAIPVADQKAIGAKFGAKLRALAGAAPKPMPGAKSNPVADAKTRAWNAFKATYNGPEAERTPAWVRLVGDAVPQKTDYNAFTAADWDAVIAAIDKMAPGDDMPF